MARVIKKYKNRKLYDMEASRYVNLMDIKELLRNQEDVRVVDNTTGKDITSQILIQIILQSEDDGELPVDGLKQVVMLGRNTIHQIMQKTREIGRTITERVDSDSRGGDRSREDEQAWERVQKGLDMDIIRQHVGKFIEWLSPVFSEKLHNNLLGIPTHADLARLYDKIQMLEHKLETLSNVREKTRRK